MTLLNPHPFVPPPVAHPRLLVPPAPAGEDDAGFPALPPGTRVLIVDDEPANVALLEDLLATVVGAPETRSTTDPRQVLDLFRTFRPDAVLLDLRMPHLDGFAVMELLGREIPAGVYLPILVLTADASPRIRQRALAVGATDFLAKPFDNLEAVLRLRNLLTARVQHLLLQHNHDRLEAAVAARTAELHRSHAQLVRQERLSALGTMAAGVAHDFNNALTLISGYGQLALGRLRGEEDRHLPTTGLLTSLLEATRHAAETVSRIRDFARPVSPDAPRLPVCLNAVAREALETTRPRWAARQPAVDVLLDLQPALPRFPGDAGELRDAVTNLVFNAVDALFAGGTVTLRTYAVDGSDVVLEVSDNGVGMDEETQRRCLEPFFTTKGEAGTGLGLAMVYGAVQRHGGSVEVASQPGRGTTFRLRLPQG